MQHEFNTLTKTMAAFKHNSTKSPNHQSFWFQPVIALHNGITNSTGRVGLKSKHGLPCMGLLDRESRGASCLCLVHNPSGSQVLTLWCVHDASQKPLRRTQEPIHHLCLHCIATDTGWVCIFLRIAALASISIMIFSHYNAAVLVPCFRKKRIIKLPLMQFNFMQYHQRPVRLVV